MTLQTPLHLQRGSLVKDRHVVDLSVTGRAADAFLYVNAVIEVRVVGQVVYADPLEWFAGAEARPHGLEIWTIGPDLFVAIHARRS